MAEEHYERLVRPRLEEALSDSPVVLIHGPRQCGKTTLARRIGDEGGYSYASFDDETVLASARADPVGFIDGLPARAVLDEVQRAPEIFASLKASVDRDRRPGRPFTVSGILRHLGLPTSAPPLTPPVRRLRTIRRMTPILPRSRPDARLRSHRSGSHPGLRSDPRRLRAELRPTGRDHRQTRLLGHRMPLRLTPGRTS
jgi:hypothetical protein